ncbi:MAG: ABC-three component system protein [Methanothrix sp.]
MITSVRSNKALFKAVDFTPGFNVVLADRTKDSAKKDTRNGLGKSTLIEIIQFCLGSDATKSGLIKDPLAGWSFSLDLEIGKDQFSFTRSIDSPKKVIVTGDISEWPIRPRKQRKSGVQELPIRDFNDALGYLMFGLSNEDNSIHYEPGFRGLISYFVRRGRDAFSTPFEYYRRQPEVDKQVLNSFLLGLEWRYASEWQDLKDKEKLLANLRRAAKKGLVKDIIGSLGELEAKRVRLDTNSRKEEEQLKCFRVHPQYQEIEFRANKFTKEIHALENENVADSNLLDYYNQSIQQEHPPSSEDIIKMYERAEVDLPGLVKQRFENVQKFHFKLVENRRVFLESEISRLGQVIESRRENIRQKSDSRAELMEILRTHGALEEYTKLQRLHMETVSQLKEIEQRIKDLKKIEQEKSKLAIEQELLLQRARSDLEERHVQTNRAIDLFNTNSEALYEAPGNLVIDIQPPTGYQFKVEIERSGSQGVGSMKVFCYDLMLIQLWANKPKSPGFLVHDSTIFDGVDERQRALALELAARESQERGFQYICTLNSDMIPWKEFSRNFDIERFTRLRLTDATDDGCLLGIRF